MKETHWLNWLIRTATTWGDIHSVVEETGVDSLDASHRELIKYALDLNRLIVMIDSENFDVNLVKDKKEKLEILQQFAIRKYEEEERLIEKNNLPGLEKQKTEHFRILKNIDDAIKDFSDGKIKELRVFEGAFLETVIYHIKGSDRQTFRLENWKESILNSASWRDLTDCTREMGMPELDQEHRDILDRILKVDKIIEQYGGKALEEPGKGVVAEYFDSLGKLVKSHFSNEESFISTFDTVGLGAVKKERLLYITNLEKNRSNALSGVTKISPELKYNLVFQWIAHINTVDYGKLRKELWWEKILINATHMKDISFLIKKTGLAEVDEAFGKALAASFELNRFFGEVAEKDGALITNLMVEKQFEELIDSVKELFDIEEKFMTGNGLEGIESHMVSHRKILDGITRYRVDFHQDRIAISAKMKVHILGALINHLDDEDIQMFNSLGDR